jgi:hypothetical protein
MLVGRLGVGLGVGLDVGLGDGLGGWLRSCEIDCAKRRWLPRLVRWAVRAIVN